MKTEYCGRHFEGNPRAHSRFHSHRKYDPGLVPTLASRVLWILVCQTSITCLSATITGFGTASWSAADANLGLAGAVIEDFEDTTLSPGLKVKVESPSRGSYGPVSTLPFVFNSSQDCCGAFTSALMWDGTHGLMNRPFLPIASYSNDGGWSDVFFLFEAGASSVGFSYGQAEANILISVDLGAGFTYLANSTSVLPTSGGRNGYLRIDAGPGEIIYGVKLDNQSGNHDGILYDHVAFKPAEWSFSIMAAVSANTAAHHGGLNAIATLISNQIHVVNQRFNAAPGFHGKFNFKVVTNYEFAGSPTDERGKPHIGYDYLLVYDGFSGAQGGWIGRHQSIHHSWKETFLGGPFGPDATDGLVHEFGHARGAIDLYALNVSTNPINGGTFQAVRSIMNETYGVLTWDEHSRHLINKNSGRKAPPISYITEAFPPSISVLVRDHLGNPLPGAQVRLYPVGWYSQSVGTASINGTTDSTGRFKPFLNPFGPGSSSTNWDIQFPNFLVTASSTNGAAASVWMPLYEVQNAHFNFPGSNYVLELSLPSPPIPLRIYNGSWSSNSFRFMISGPSNQPVVIETTTNLANPFWWPVETNTPIQGFLPFTDSSASNFSSRFYRLRPR